VNELKTYLRPFGLFLIIIFILISIFDSNESSVNNNSPEDLNEITNSENKLEDENIEIPSYSPTSRPVNGFSPYNNLYGKGIYDNSTDNIINVTAPLTADIVIFIKDIYTERNIRNEYVRAGSAFSMTGIPYGTYKFIYTYGNDWCSYAPFKNGQSNGNFLSDKGVGKSDKIFDVDFEVGYYGTYSLTLQLMTNGNLVTVQGSENEI